MASASDIRDILNIGGNEPNKVTKASLLRDKGPEKKKAKQTFKRPEGMHRELYALLYSDNMDQPPMLPTDNIQTYQTAKAKLGCKVVRPWQWVAFNNPARTDGAVFYHWQRVEDEGKDYKFTKFNKTIQVPTFSEQEYNQYLFSPHWTLDETSHLFELATRFDLRWHVMFDRYDHDRFPVEKKRTLEDLKERYYHICNRIAKVRKHPGGEAVQKIVYDADHERRRRLQLNRLLSRTEAQVEEEAMLVQELKKIESRKKEREKKSQDLQKLIAFDSTAESSSSKKVEKRSTSKKKSDKSKKEVNEEKSSDSFGIRFPDYKSSGVMLRSQMMKLPSNISQRRVKSLELLLSELKLESNPMPTETVVQLFNKLRSDMVYLYDLKVAYANYEMDLQSLTYKWDVLAPNQPPPVHTVSNKKKKSSKKFLTSTLS